MLPSLGGLSLATGGKNDDIFKRLNELRNKAPKNPIRKPPRPSAPPPRPPAPPPRPPAPPPRPPPRPPATPAPATPEPAPLVHEVNKNLRKIPPNETDEEFQRDMKSQEDSDDDDVYVKDESKRLLKAFEEAIKKNEAAEAQRARRAEEARKKQEAENAAAAQRAEQVRREEEARNRAALEQQRAREREARERAREAAASDDVLDGAREAEQLQRDLEALPALTSE